METILIDNQLFEVSGESLALPNASGKRGSIVFDVVLGGSYLVIVTPDIGRLVRRIEGGN